jgi:vancomycin resistance protein YoaR
VSHCDHHVQRRVLRRLQGHHPSAAHHLIDRYPAGRGSHRQLRRIDLQFQNDTSHGILIRTYYSDTSITVTLYGDNDGRTVREENRTLTNPVPVTDKSFGARPRRPSTRTTCARH